MSGITLDLPGRLNQFIAFCDDRVVLYKGDSRVILPELPPCDLLVTDPPTGNDYMPSASRRKRPHDFGEMLGNQDREAIIPLLAQSITSIKPHRHCYIFGDWRNCDLRWVECRN